MPGHPFPDDPPLHVGEDDEDGVDVAVGDEFLQVGFGQLR